MIKITINNKDFELLAGLTQVKELYERAECGEGYLFLGRDGGLDIPVLDGEWIILRGGEKFVVGNADLGENPTLRKKISIEFNGEKLKFDKAKIVGCKLKAKDGEFPNGRMFVDIPDGVDAEIEDNMILVLQDDYVLFVVPPSDDNDSDKPVDLENCGRNDRHPPKGQRYYRIKIDGKKYKVEGGIATGATILALVNKAPEEWELNEKIKGSGRITIEPDQKVDLTKKGVERFETIRLKAPQGGK